jgi:hypothetical protein
MGFDPQAIEVYFIAGTFKLSKMQPCIRQEMERLGDFALIVVDTSAAFFEGEDENSNAQQGAHARRVRDARGPCVLVACHPPKNAGDDNIQPRGGGAFLAEVDGNLIARNDDSAVANPVGNRARLENPRRQAQQVDGPAQGGCLGERQADHQGPRRLQPDTERPEVPRKDHLIKPRRCNRIMPP